MKFGVQYQRLSKSIEVGRLNKSETLFLDGKEDHTERIVRSVAEYLLDEIDDGNHPFEILVRHDGRPRVAKLRVSVEDIT